MLVLHGKKDSEVVIDLRDWGLGLVVVTTVDVRGAVVRTGFSGDKRVPIYRKEVFDKIEATKRKDGGSDE